MCCSKDRIAHIAKRTRESGADAFLVRNTPDIEWATAFDNVFDEEQAHSLFVRSSGEAFLHTDSRYIEAMRREAESSPVNVDAKACSLGNWVIELLANASTLAIQDSMSIRQLRALEAALEGKSLLETTDIVVELRSVKDEAEIVRLKEAQAVTDAAFTHMLGFIEPGMTEREVALELDGFMLANGADSLAFPSIVASGTNGASPHAIVSDRVIERGECIVMDFGAKKRGYCSDMTRTVFVGKPSEKMQRAWKALKRANEECEAMIKPGATGMEVHEHAEQVLSDAGFGGKMGHGLGHGVGIEIHELPVLSPRNPLPLAVGNVVTVEPGIYLPGEFGMRLEDFGVVTENGFDVFTSSTHDMVII